mgnify:CR=1 FL=1
MANGQPGFIGAMVSADDQSVDSLIVLGVLAVVAMIFFQGYDLIVLRHEFSPWTFGSGVAAVLTGVGGGKMVRDKIRFKPSTTDVPPNTRPRLPTPPNRGEDV